MEVTERGYDSLFSPQDIVYLSPDSEQGYLESYLYNAIFCIHKHCRFKRSCLCCFSIDLEEVDRYKVYVIGGIVDRSSPSKVHNKKDCVRWVVCAVRYITFTESDTAQSQSGRTGDSPSPHL